MLARATGWFRPGPEARQTRGVRAEARGRISSRTGPARDAPEADRVRVKWGRLVTL